MEKSQAEGERVLLGSDHGAIIPEGPQGNKESLPLWKEGRLTITGHGSLTSIKENNPDSRIKSLLWIKAVCHWELIWSWLPLSTYYGIWPEIGLKDMQE